MANDDVEITTRYGEAHPREFGGLYLDPPSLVALFTQELDSHATALRRQVAHPSFIRVARADRTWREVRAANEDVTRILMIENRRPDVTSVGIRMHNGQFVVAVGLSPYTREQALAVEHLVAGHPVTVEPGQRVYLAGNDESG